MTPRTAGYLSGIALIAVGCVTAGVISACSSSTSKANQPHLDAGQQQVTDLTKALTLAMPDGFNNVAVKCIVHNGLYVTYHGDGAYGSITVVPNDPNCVTGTYVDPAAH